jgi:hypothetical protein
MEDAIVWRVPRPIIPDIEMAFLLLAAERSASDSSLRGILMGNISGGVIEHESTAGVEGLKDGVTSGRLVAEL